MLKKRQLNLLYKIFEESDYLPVKSYAKLMGISEKSIRRDLDDLDIFLKKYDGKITKKVGAGIKLDISIENKTKLMSCINQLSENEDNNKLIFSSSNARKQDIILNLLLQAPNVYSISNLADQYFISKSSIHTDLIEVEKELKKYQLSIIKNTSGSYIQGNEIQIRRALLNELYIFLKDYGLEKIVSLNIQASQMVICFLNKVFNDDYVDVLQEMIEKLNVDYSNLLTHREKTWLLIGILVHIYRMNQFGVIRKNDDGRIAMFEHIRGFNEIVEFEENSIKSNLTIEELSFLNWLFSNVGLTYVPKINLEEIAEMFSGDFIDAFSAITGLPLRSKETFCLSVQQHIFFMLTRVSNNQRFKNPILERMRNEYRSMEMVCRIICQILCDKYALPEINDDEISYLMVYIQSELICYESSLDTAIVFDEKPSIRSLFKAQLNRRFHNLKIDFYSDFKKIPNERYDLIISTIHVGEESDINYVSPVLRENDFDLIDCLITKIISDKKNYLLELKRILNDLNDIGVKIERTNTIEFEKVKKIIWKTESGNNGYLYVQNAENSNRLLIRNNDNDGIEVCFLFNDWDYMLFASKFVYLLESSPLDIVNHFKKYISEDIEYE